MDSRKVLSALCYFSIFFGTFIFPLIVFLASEDPQTKKHAKKAFLSHLLPLIPVPLLIFAIIYETAATTTAVPIFTILCVILIVLVSICVVIWNIVKGIKVLNEK